MLLKLGSSSKGNKKVLSAKLRVPVKIKLYCAKGAYEIWQFPGYKVKRGKINTREFNLQLSFRN